MNQALNAFNQAFEDNHRALHAYFFGHTGSREIAEDLLQEAMLRAWRSIGQLLALSEPQRRHWLFAVARNLLIDHYRHQAAQTNALEATRREALVHPPQSREDTDIDAILLDEAIQQLPDDLRTVIALQALGGLNSTEIGEVVKKPAGTVRYQLSMARRQLARALSLDDEPSTIDARPEKAR